MEEWDSRLFCGNELTKEDLEMGHISYSTFSKAFNHIMNNDIIQQTCERFQWEQVNGTDYYDDEDCEIFQYYIVDDAGANLIKKFLPNDILLYCVELDMYVWGITHYGTPWTIVPTDIKINIEDD